MGSSYKSVDWIPSDWFLLFCLDPWIREIWARTEPGQSSVSCCCSDPRFLTSIWLSILWTICSVHKHLFFFFFFSRVGPPFLYVPCAAPIFPTYPSTYSLFRMPTDSVVRKQRKVKRPQETASLERQEEGIWNLTRNNGNATSANCTHGADFFSPVGGRPVFFGLFWCRNSVRVSEQ
jgi:hypothetical protein